MPVVLVVALPLILLSPHQKQKFPQESVGMRGLFPAPVHQVTTMASRSTKTLPPVFLFCRQVEALNTWRSNSVKQEVGPVMK